MADYDMGKALGLLRAAINCMETDDVNGAERYWAECKDVLKAGAPMEVYAGFVHLYSDAYERREERHPTGQSIEVA